MKYKLKVYSIWEFGKRKDAEGKPHQEDSLYPTSGKATEDDRTFILCDGMGGHDAGEVASATVCETMGETIRNNGHDAEGVFTDEDLKTAIAAAFDALDKKDNGAEKKMGTTMTFLKLHNEGVTIAHMGDSRVYHIRPGKTGNDTRILHETEDHSLVNDLIKIGELTREEARLSKQKNVITRAMQPHMERRPKADVYHTADIKPGDYFYMCSDGMLEQPDMEDGTVLKRVFSVLGETDERRVEILRGATDENRDNHTAFVIHVVDVIDPVPVVEKPDMPTQKKAVVEDEQCTEEEQTDHECPEHSMEFSVCPMNKKKSEDNDLKRKRHSSAILKITIGITVVALCLLCMKFVKSCTFASDKERIEVLEEKPERGEGLVKPTKPMKPGAAQQPTRMEAGQTTANEVATPSTVQSQSIPPSIGEINLNQGSLEGVVSSDQQVVTETVNK